MLNVLVYVVGWLLFVAAQAHNSVLSKTNSLSTGWSGYKLWLQTHAVELAIRAFFSALGYGFIVHTVAGTVQNIGFHLTGVAFAGVGGFSANTLCYQFIGLFPGLRAEVADSAPPPMRPTVPADSGPGPLLPKPSETK
jgi:hypothetical protein